MNSGEVFRVQFGKAIEFEWLKTVTQSDKKRKIMDSPPGLFFTETKPLGSRS